jgi:hypothetical protein
MNVQKFDLVIWFREETKIYYNLSRTAVKKYLDWHQENPEFEHYDILEA